MKWVQLVEDKSYDGFYEMVMNILVTYLRQEICWKNVRLSSQNKLRIPRMFKDIRFIKYCTTNENIFVKYDF